MKIGFFVNDVKTEQPHYATTLMAREARKRGHDVHYITANDFSCQPGGELHIRSRVAPARSTGGCKGFLQGLQRAGSRLVQLPATELDVLMLRNDPAEDAEERPWAQSVGVMFGQEVARRGVLVLNDPFGLSRALNKLYFQRFPEHIRPRTLISRDIEEIKRFAREQKHKIVIKPLQGSGGQGVFLLRRDEDANVNQIIETVREHGYVVAQEYAPGASKGDIRLFLMNGRPLSVNGRYAALRRVNPRDDLRSNLWVGGRPEKVEIGRRELNIAEAVGPRLMQDGMFLVGLDIVGDKLLEVNVFSPGGLHSACKLQSADFTTALVQAIERKVQYARNYPGAFNNAQLAIF